MEDQSFDIYTISEQSRTFLSHKQCNDAYQKYFYNLLTFRYFHEDINCNNFLPFYKSSISSGLYFSDFNRLIGYFHCENKQKNIKTNQIAKGTLDFLEDKPKSRDFFIEVTFPNLFLHFISTKPCKYAYTFLEQFYTLDDFKNWNDNDDQNTKCTFLLELLAKFIKSDPNFNNKLIESFNYQIGDNGQAIVKASKIAFDSLDNYRKHALKSFIDFINKKFDKNEEKKITWLYNLTTSIIQKTIEFWNYDIYTLNSGSFSKLSPNEAVEILQLDLNNCEEEFPETDLSFLTNGNFPMYMFLSEIDINIIDGISKASGYPSIKNNLNYDEEKFDIEKAYFFYSTILTFTSQIIYKPNSLIQTAFMIYEDSLEDSSKNKNYCHYKKEIASEKEKFLKTSRESAYSFRNFRLNRSYFKRMLSQILYHMIKKTEGLTDFQQIGDFLRGYVKTLITQTIPGVPETRLQELMNKYFPKQNPFINFPEFADNFEIIIKELQPSCNIVVLDYNFSQLKILRMIQEKYYLKIANQNIGSRKDWDNQWAGKFVNKMSEFPYSSSLEKILSTMLKGIVARNNDIFIEKLNELYLILTSNASDTVESEDSLGYLIFYLYQNDEQNFNNFHMLLLWSIDYLEKELEKNQKTDFAKKYLNNLKALNNCIDG